MAIDLIAKDVILYSVWGGSFKHYAGAVTGASHDPRQGRFRANDGSQKTFQCAPREGEVLNSVVWLYANRPDNEEMAKSILNTYFTWRIVALNEQIDNFMAKIKLLE